MDNGRFTIGRDYDAGLIQILALTEQSVTLTRSITATALTEQSVTVTQGPQRAMRSLRGASLQQGP